MQTVKRMKKAQGFTLLETLVAFTIMAMSYATLMQIISGSARNAVKASESTKIAMLAQSKMDELGLFEVLEEGTTQGEFDEKTQWELNIQPFEAPYEGNVNQDFSTVELLEVTLIISTDKGREFQFKTLRSVTPDFSQPR